MIYPALPSAGWPLFDWALVFFRLTRLSWTRTKPHPLRTPTRFGRKWFYLTAHIHTRVRARARARTRTHWTDRPINPNLLRDVPCAGESIVSCARPRNTVSRVRTRAHAHGSRFASRRTHDGRRANRPPPGLLAEAAIERHFSLPASPPPPPGILDVARWPRCHPKSWQ